MKVALYARVSTIDKDQNPEVQLEQLRGYCQRMGWEIFTEYVDHASAVDYLRRTDWTQMMKDASTRRFDKLLVYKMSRAFRSSIHAYNSLDLLQKYKVDFRSLTEDIDTSTIAGRVIFAVLAAMAEGERDQIRENVLTGMAYAKEHGTKSGLPVGRPREDIDFANICKALQSGNGSYSEAARIISSGKRHQLTAGFIFNRVKREAIARGMTTEGLKDEILTGIDQSTSRPTVSHNLKRAPDFGISTGKSGAL